MTQTARHTYDPASAQSALTALQSFLADHEGSGVEIDLQTVATLPGWMVELLLTAAKHWTAQDQPFVVTTQNPTLITRMTDIGVPAHLIAEGS